MNDRVVMGFLRTLAATPAPKEVGQARELAAWGTDVGAPSSVLTDLEAFLEVSGQVEELEVRLKGLKEERGQVWRRVRRCLEPREVDMFDEAAEWVEKDEGVRAKGEASQGKDEGWGVPTDDDEEDYQIVFECSNSEFIEALNHRCTIDRSHGAIRRLCTVHAKSLNDLGIDEIQRIERIRQEFEVIGRPHPPKIKELFTWARRYLEQHLEGARMAVVDDGPEPGVPEVAREMWEALDPITQGNITEIVFFRDSADQVTVTHGQHGLRLDFHHGRGWHLGIFEATCFISSAVVLAIHAQHTDPGWKNSMFEVRSLTLARMLEEERLLPLHKRAGWGLTRLYSPEGKPVCDGLWEMVLLKHRKQVKDGAWRLKEPRAKRAAAREVVL